MKLKLYLFLGALSLLTFGCKTVPMDPIAVDPSDTITIDPIDTMVIDPVLPPVNNPIEFNGRIGTLDDSTKIFYWSGTSAKIHFKGDTIRFSMKDVKEDNYYHAILDGDIVDIIKPLKTLMTYSIFAGEGQQDHTFELLKISEYPRGETIFSGFDIGNGTYYNIPKKENRIVYYGNSITCAYGVDDTVGDSPDGTYTNFGKSYARLTATEFDANYQSISRSGIGIMISWFDQIMPQLYNRANPNDPTQLWDFTHDSTDIVVINLLQNDSWLVNRPELKVFKDKFGTTKPTSDEIIKAYKEFVLLIRASHPSADIICLLGNMDITKQGSIWPGYVDQAVTLCNDDKIHTLSVAYKNTAGHPEEAEQILIAEALIGYIKNKGLLKY